MNVHLQLHTQEEHTRGLLALAQEFGTADNIPEGFEAYIDLTVENNCTSEQYGLSGSGMGISHTRGRA